MSLEASHGCAEVATGQGDQVNRVAREGGGGEAGQEVTKEQDLLCAVFGLGVVQVVGRGRVALGVVVIALYLLICSCNGCLHTRSTSCG